MCEIFLVLACELSYTALAAKDATLSYAHTVASSNITSLAQDLRLDHLAWLQFALETEGLLFGL